MTNQEFNSILQKYPDLTAHGFGVDAGGSFAQERTALVNGYESVLQTFYYLIKIIPTGKINKKAGSSYRLKHVVERAIGWYIREGEFIAAAIAAGFKIQRIPGTTGVYLDIKI